MTADIEAPENEFASLSPRFAALGLAPDEVPAVSRRWVNVSTGGHISGVVWGSAPPEVVLVHGLGGEARSLDEVALRLGRAIVVLDLPGSGRSTGPATRPRRAGPLLAEAVASFAPRAQLIAGIGEGGLAALASLARRPQVAALVLVDALPDLDASPEGATDARLLWEQLGATPASIELIRPAGSVLTEAQVDLLRARRPDAVVTVLDHHLEALGGSGAGALTEALLAAADRRSDH